MDPATFSLVPLSIDLYMAFEIAEGGDLYEMRGEMTAREVRSLMRQLTSAVLPPQRRRLAQGHKEREHAVR